MDLGMEIRLNRTKARMTQKELAHEVGVSDNYISGIERNKRLCSLSTLKRIADALDLDLHISLEERNGESA